MNSQQPNFEHFKTILYKHIKNSPDFLFSALGGEFIGFNKKLDKQKNVLNDIIDRIDIRMVSSIVNNTKNVIKYPYWLVNNQYVICDNDSGYLDLIRL